MRIYLSARGVIAHVELPRSWPGRAVLVGLAEALAETTHECPDCPDVPAPAFLLALAEAAPLEVAADLLKIANDWR